MPRTATATATATSALALRLLRSGFDWIRQAIFPTVPFRAFVACLPVVCCMHAVVSFFLWLPAANFASIKTQRQAEAANVNERVRLSVCECVNMCEYECLLYLLLSGA